MVGHQHVRIICLMKNFHDLIHVDVAFVGPGFAKVVQPTTDISEVNVEDLFSFGEVFDDRW